MVHHHVRKAVRCHKKRRIVVWVPLLPPRLGVDCFMHAETGLLLLFLCGCCCCWSFQVVLVVGWRWLFVLLEGLKDRSRVHSGLTPQHGWLLTGQGSRQRSFVVGFVHKILRKVPILANHPIQPFLRSEGASSSSSSSSPSDNAAPTKQKDCTHQG
jgi:hypothetical protein